MGSIRVDFLFILFFSTTFLFCFSQAQCNVYLSTTGTDSSTCGSNSTSPCLTLSQTVKILSTSSCLDNTIFVSHGTYNGASNRNVPFVFNGTRLVIQPSSPSDTVVFDGESQSYIMAIDIVNGSVTIQNITFTRGSHQNMHAGGLTITYRHSGSYDILSSRFINCNGFDAGGLYASANLPSIISSCEFLNCSGDNGGGASLTGGVITILSTNFTKNSAVQYGGGLNVNADSILLQICSFSNNTAVLGGGGSFSSTAVKIESSHFFHNMATDDGGGAVYISQSETTSISDTDIGFNSAFIGGGIFFQWLETQSQVVLSNLLIYSNMAKSLGGGAYISEALDVTINNLVSEDNTAVTGGGLYIKSIHNFGITASTFRNNLASNKGGGVACDSTNQITTTSVLFYSNSASDCAYSDHVIDSGTCPGIFTQCAQKQSVPNCASCPGSVCMEDRNSTFHCFSNNTLNCVCPFPSQSPAPSSNIPGPSHTPVPSNGPPPVTPAGTIAGIVIGVLVSIVVVVGVAYYCWLKYSRKATDYVPVR